METLIMVGAVIVLVVVALAAVIAAMNKGMDNESMFISALFWVGGLVVACGVIIGGFLLVFKISF